MPQGSSSHSISANVDLSHQSGVMAVLAAVRASTINPSQKSELRDLVFEFTNGGRDETVRLQLEQKLASYGVTVAPLSARGAASTHATPFGTVRPAPSFTPVEYAVPPAVSAPSAPSIVPPAPVASATPPIQPPTPAPAVAVPNAVSAPAPVSHSPSIAQSSSITPVAVQSIPQPAVATSAPTPSATPTPVPAQGIGSADAAAEVNLRRIREIKASVNEQVGNPVNLVDIDNAVGREYMSALLEAMKKVNAGAAGVAAMQRLEAAFVSVQAVLAARPVAAPGAATDTAAPAIAHTQTPVAQASVPAEPAPVTAPLVPPVSVASDQQPVITSVPPTVTPPVVTNPPSEAVPPAIPVPPVAPQATQSREQSSIPSPSASETVPPIVPPSNNAPSGYAQPAVTGAPSTPSPIPSLADNPIKLRSPLDLPDPAVVSALGPNDDPLMTKEIDAGLEQLLLEWSLFKKSGLFGTGPKGREHPLYKKIAPLPIPLLLAGRFEGATQEIKQSITDYMNGWRYEQGIVYEQGEIFEKYLRRVIKHIVDLQKQRPSK